MSELVEEYIEFCHEDTAVRTVRSGDEALAGLEANDDVDCIVSDYELPGLDGLHLFEAVRDRWPDLPFILFTGHGSEELAERANQSGITDYTCRNEAARSSLRSS